MSTTESSLQLPYASDLDLPALWDEFTRTRRPGAWSTQHEFRQYLATLVSDPETIDIWFCNACAAPEWGDNCYGVTGVGSVCESCEENYPRCDSCEERHSPHSLTRTLSDYEVCSYCLSGYYSYCDYCDGYYHEDDYADHRHGERCCESPQLSFKIRNDGSAPLANDTRISLTLPAGVISPAGMVAIRRHLRDSAAVLGSANSDFYAMRHLSYEIEEVGSKWQTKDGNFAKRLSRYAYKNHGLKLTPEVMSQVGNIARDHSNAVDVRIEVTRDLNQDASYFYHEDSCWWGGYSDSRCALKTNGGFGIRSFDQYGNVSGRAWVMPLRRTFTSLADTETGKLVPTFNTETPDAFVVFNGYGDLSGYAAARIIAHMAGWTYRKIGFSCDPMYINAGGYLIAPEDITASYDGKSLYLPASTHSTLYESETSHAAAA